MLGLKTRHASLEDGDRLDYIGLSYTWETEKDVVLVKDEEDRQPLQELQVSANLVEALKFIRKKLVIAKNGEDIEKIRKPRQKLLFWIDQLCINQNDLIEKERQVRMMVITAPLYSRPDTYRLCATKADIYGQAEQALVWLGSESGNSKLGFATLAELDDELLLN